MLKNITHQHRAIFLALFIKEVILNKLEKIKKEQEKQTPRIIALQQPEVSEQEEQEKIKKEQEPGKEYIESLLSSQPKQETKQEEKTKTTTYPRKIQHEEDFSKKLTKPLFPKKSKLRKFQSKRKPSPAFFPRKKPRLTKHFFSQPLSSQKDYQKSSPLPTNQQVDIDLGKLNPLLNDNQINMIECPGPNKYLRIKKAGRVSMTKITISQKEIKEIIDNFAKKARVPVIGGVFKTAVGNLTITAVISDFVGSRFLITRHSPYSLLEHQGQQIQQAPFHHSKRFRPWPGPRKKR